MTTTSGEWGTLEKASGAMAYAYGPDGPSEKISSECLAEISKGSIDIRGRVGGGRTSVRDGLTFGDYQFYRPSEAIPRKQKEIIAACDESYQRVGLLRNVIDLMSDFASQGIEIYHPNKTKQRRYRAWFAKVNGKERSERFLNLLYRHGNVVIKRAYADLNVGDMDDLERGIAGRSPDQPEDIPYERSPRVFKNRIPLQYTFLNPTAVDVIGGDLALFAGQPRYSLKLPESLIRVIKSPKTADDRRLVGLLPPYIADPVRAGKKAIQLDPTKIEVYHYKKDDWQQWANPMTYSILADLKLYEKNKLADMAALDGAVSHIRFWRLGLPEHKIQPGPAAFALLREQLLMASGGGGTLDLIWDATLDLKESSTDIYNFLGMKKYEPVLQAIFAGLGIPQTLTGGKEGGGMTGSAMSLKTLIERLQYGRDLLRKFWDKELMILQEAFGDRNPAQVHFDNMSLSDEANEKMLWFHLYDRDIIGLDTIREKFGTIADVEDARIKSDYKGRDDDEVPPKAGPFVESQPELSLQKIALQTGVVSPKDVGLDKGSDRLVDLEKQKVDIQQKQGDADISMRKKELDIQQKQGQDIHQQRLQQNDDLHKQKLAHQDVEHKTMLPVRKRAMRQKLSQQSGPKGAPGQGRPPGAGDTQKRKQRVDTPRTGASLMATQAWARNAQRDIANIVTPIHLSRCKKKSMRNLTEAQALDLEEAKFRLLCSFSPGDEIDRDVVESRLDDLLAPNPLIESLMKAWLEGARVTPTLEEVREMQATAYAIAHSTRED
jgi:hypothetical protein